MSRGVLTAMTKLHGPFVPDPRWEKAGMTPRGEQLFIERSDREESFPLLDEEGDQLMEALHQQFSEHERESAAYGRAYRAILREHQQYRKNQLGERTVGIREKRPKVVTRMFYPESEGNGNVTMVDYAPPTRAEIEEAERMKKVGVLQDAFFSQLAAQDYTPDDMANLFDLARQGRAVVPQDEAEAAEEGEEYPINVSVGRWKLSNGQIIKGKKVEAVEAEAALQPVEPEGY